MGQIFSSALIYCGTVFGAGFASGQEVVEFFSSHYLWGVFVSIIVGFLFSFFGAFICMDSSENNIHNAGEYFKLLYPSNLASLLNFICTSFLAVSFCIMIAGCGELFFEQMHIRPIFGSLISLVFCYEIMRKKVTGLAFFNTLVTPLMIAGTVVLSVLILSKCNSTNVLAGNESLGHAGLSGLIYISFNIAVSSAVLVPCGAQIDSKRNAFMGGLIGGIFIAVILVLLSLVLFLNPNVWTHQMPFFSLVGEMFPKVRPLCAIILYCAMLTTAASSGVSLISQVKKETSGWFPIILCTLAFFASFISFGVLVKTMYTAFGVCGLLLIFGIVKRFFRKVKISALSKRISKL